MQASNQGGGLFGIIKNLKKNKKQELRILVLGLDNAGKTTILKSLSNEVICFSSPGYHHYNSNTRFQHQKYGS